MTDWNQIVAGINNDAKALLVKSYEGELVGQAMYRELADNARNDAERDAYEALLQVEVVLAGKFDPALVEVLAVDETKTEAEAHAFVKPMIGKDFSEVSEMILPPTEVSLDEFYRLREDVPAELLPIVDLLIEHEVALVELFKENSGKPGSSPDTAAVGRLLTSLAD